MNAAETRIENAKLKAEIERLTKQSDGLVSCVCSLIFVGGGERSTHEVVRESIRFMRMHNLGGYAKKADEVETPEPPTWALNEDRRWHATDEHNGKALCGARLARILKWGTEKQVTSSVAADHTAVCAQCGVKKPGGTR